MKKTENFDNKKVCPYWLIHSFDNVFRKLVHNPKNILSPYIKEGDFVADIGCGIGYFSIPMARMVGNKGKVYAVDLQSKMLDGVKRRAEKTKLLDRICLHKVGKNRIGLKQKLDFILAFWMVHEVSDTKEFLMQIVKLLKPSAKFLLVEPGIHVSKKLFNNIKDLCTEVGFKLLAEPKIPLSRAVLLSK